jgi:hypothetical protein
MKIPCRALCVFFLVVCAARAQKEEEESPIGDFAPLDDDLVLYIPKFAVKVGFRGLTGAKTAFSQKGYVSSFHSIGDPSGIAGRLYQDGYVSTDTRSLTDPSGNSVPITPDGRTNNWKFVDPSQVGTGIYAGEIGFHAYEATVSDTSVRKVDNPMAFGVELSLERAMGSLFGGKIKWGIIGGMSINQISDKSQSNLAASVLTTTDYYSLNGQNAPTTLPYSGGGDTAVLLNADPNSTRTFVTTTTTNTFSQSSKIRGSYMTFRVGPTISIPISSRFSATMSAGAVVVFAGSTLDVTQTFKPETGDVLTDSLANATSRLLPGFYVDADVQYTMTDTAGLYLGGVYQNSGSYTQVASSPDGRSAYSTRVDLSSLQGIRAGVSFKF